VTGALTGKVALVTGGASGLGKAIAGRLAREGARVVITDVQVDLGRKNAAESGLTFFEQDVRDAARWSDLIREIEHAIAPLNILVNNAGIVGPIAAATPENTPLEHWQQVFAVNVEGVFLGCRAVIPAMRRAGGGSIINISSVAALAATPEATAYGATKGAVRHITRSVALHCAKDGCGVRCNSVHPGNVLTPLLEGAMTEIARARGVNYQTVYEEFKNESPLGEFQRPEDIAYAVQFLASDEARHITGIQLVVDGGLTIAHGAV
jgi:3(or 17)beta-hydroxysteroid dehydrogenase